MLAITQMQVTCFANLQTLSMSKPFKINESLSGMRSALINIETAKINKKEVHKDVKG